MSRTPQPPASTPGWTRRHKRLLAAGSIILLVLLVCAVAGRYYIRSGRVNRFILAQVQTALAGYRIRAEVGRVDLSWFVRRAKAQDIKLDNREAGHVLAPV